MEHEFGSGLRAHLGKHNGAPEAETVSAAVAIDPARPQPAPAPRKAPLAPGAPSGPSFDERIERLSAAEAELSFRERRVGEREMSFNVAVQRVVYQLAQEMLEGGVPALPQDEVAVARARRGGRAA